MLKKIKRNINYEKTYKLTRVLLNITHIPYRFDYKNKYITINNYKSKIKIFNKNSKEVIIYIHGGGWTFGNVDVYSNTLSKISKKLNKTIITFNYSLAPEHKYPEQIDFSYEMIYYLVNKYSIKNLILMGDSAGANIVSIISELNSKNKDIKIDKQILLYPALKGNYKTIEKDEDYLSKKQLISFEKMYTNKKEAFPLNYKKNLNLPKTFIVVCSKDPLLDEGYEYYIKNKLNKIMEFDTYHGFLLNPFEKNNKKILIREIEKFL